MNNKLERTHERVIVIGLDGADWRLLKPWIAEGHLPTLARLLEEGAHGTLRSTIRPESSVAWSSFATGVNPGKHSIFGFVQREANSYQYKLANGNNLRAPRFWDVLSQAGRRVGLLNIPFTYPPRPINGFMVTGMLTPNHEVPFTYPAELKSRLLAHFDNYLLDAGDRTEDKGALIASVKAFTRQQVETVRLLWQVEAYEMLGVVFTGPDRLQHFLWEDIDSQHPASAAASREEFGSALREHFILLDRAVGQIIAQVSDRTLVLVMSDHGFNGCARRFYVNRWLKEEGLLAIKEGELWRAAAVNRLSSLKNIPLLRQLKRTFLPDNWGAKSLQTAVSTQLIDWSRTKVFYAPDGGLRLNVQGREPQGIVSPGKAYAELRQNLSRMLLDLRDPLSNRSILSQVYLSEELYDGRFAQAAPDLILEPVRNDPQAKFNFVLDSSVNMDGPIFTSSAPYSGNHTLDGILIAWGSAVAPGHKFNNAHIVDLAPTILAALDVPIPSYMDGRTLNQLFLPEDKLRAATDTSASPELPDEDKQTTPSQEDEDVIAARLRNLGYID